MTLPSDYLDAGHVMNGYAITGHKAQGLTCDHTYVLGTESLYREWGYVAMSRGRQSNQLYHGPGIDDEDALHHPVHIDHSDGVATLAGHLRRTRAETPVSPEVSEVAAAWREVTARLDEIDIPRQQELLRHRDQLEEARAALDYTLERRQGRLEQEGSGFLRFRRRKVVGELEAERDQAVARLAEVADRLGSVDAAMAGLPDRRELGDLFQRLERHDVQLRREAAARVRGFRPAPPPYLTTALGPPPAGGWSRDRWERTATGIEHHRLRWSVTDPTKALGSRAGGKGMQASSAAIRDDIRRMAEDLRRDRLPQRGRGRAR